MEIQSDSNDIPYNKITSIFLTLFFDKKFPYDSNNGLYYDRDFSSVSLFSMPKHFPDLHPKELYVKVHDILNRNFGERPFLGKTYSLLSHWDRTDWDYFYSFLDYFFEEIGLEDYDKEK